MYDQSIYVIGHRQPDTDCVAGAIAYAAYKKALGFDARPAVLGQMNPETRFLLKKFGFEEPEMLDDARVRLDQIELDSPISISEDTSLLEAVRAMDENGREALAVTDGDWKIRGWISRSDISRLSLTDTLTSASLLKETPASFFARAVNGVIVYDDPLMELNGKVSIVTAATKKSLRNYEVKNRIVIVGNEENVQEQLIEKGAGLLIVVWAKKIDADVLEAARAHHCPVIISGYGATNTSRYLFLAPPVSMIMQTSVTSFYGYEFADDALKKSSRTRFRTFPVVNADRRLTGYATRYHLMNYRNRRLILVDHNEFSQSVPSVEKAEILEVIDHHRIRDFSTPGPINLRNETVGATTTIVATMYRENSVPIPPALAGLMLGGILSCTLNLQSPLTTERDRRTCDILAALADVDREEFAREMFSVSWDLEGKTAETLLNLYARHYDFGEYRVRMARVLIPDRTFMTEDPERIQEELEEYTDNHRLDFCALVFVSILDNGCIYFLAGSRAGWAAEVLPVRDIHDHAMTEGVGAFFMQTVPALQEAFVRNG